MQFERFRRIFHHSSYRVLLGHKDRKILSSLLVEEVCITSLSLNMLHESWINFFDELVYTEPFQAEDLDSRNSA